jgi:NAD(P)-dependent dehydrogenase (short-subunit alcohol dehydrogenase family)
VNTFRDKIAIVTGGASGIGRAVSEALAERGAAAVVVADLDATGAESVAHGIRARGGRAQAVGLDVCDAAAFQRLVDEAAADHGRLDYLFNNAGIGIAGEERDVSLEDWNRVLAVDLHGIVHGVRAAYALMVKQGSGHIVNTASLQGLVPGPGAASYVAAKYAVVGLSHTLRAEGARLGVKVSVVCPGLIDTAILVNSPIRGPGDREKLRSLIPTPMPADRCAAAILRGVAKNRATIVVTAHAKALWWLARLSPDAAIWFATLAIEHMRKVGRRD